MESLDAFLADIENGSLNFDPAIRFTRASTYVAGQRFAPGWSHVDPSAYVTARTA